MTGTLPKAYECVIDRNGDYRGHLMGWRQRQASEPHKIALWTVLRDVVYTSAREDWGLTHGPDDYRTEMPSFPDLMEELGEPSGTSDITVDELTEYLMLETEYEGPSDFIEFGTSLSEDRLPLMNSASELVDSLSGPTTYKDDEVNFPETFAEDSNYTRRLRVLNQVLAGIGFSSPGEGFVAEQLARAYRGHDPVFDPFEMLSPQPYELVDPPYNFTPVTEAMEDPTRGVASVSAVSRETLGHICFFFNQMMSGLVLLMEYDEMESVYVFQGQGQVFNDTEIANIVNNFLSRFFALFFGPEQELEDVDGLGTFVDFDLAAYFEDDGLRKQDLDAASEDLRGLLRTVQRIRTVITTSIPEEIEVDDDGNPLGNAHKAGSDVASFVDKITTGGGFHSHRITSAIVYAFSLTALLGSVIETNDRFEIELQQEWDVDDWVDLCDNIQSVIDYSAVDEMKELIQEGAIDSSAESKPLFVDTDTDSGPKSLSGAQKIQVASKLAEPVFAVFDLVQAYSGMQSASDTGESSVFLGHALAGAGAISAIAISMYSIGAAMASSAPFLVALASSNPVGWVATAGLIAVGLVSWALITFTGDHPIEIWLRNTIFGDNYEEDRVYNDPEEPTFRVNDATPAGKKRDEEYAGTNKPRMISEYVSLTNPLGFTENEATITQIDDPKGSFKGTLKTTIPLPHGRWMMLYPVIELPSKNYFVGYPLEQADISENWIHMIILRNPEHDISENVPSGDPSVKLNCRSLTYDIDQGDDWGCTLEFYANTIDMTFGIPEAYFGPNRDHYLELLVLDRQVELEVSRLIEQEGYDEANEVLEEFLLTKFPYIRRERVPVTLNVE